MDPVIHPTLLNSCARAATTAEARFRVDYPNSARRASRIFALDAQAAEAMYAITEDPWLGAHFLTVGFKDVVVPDETKAEDLLLSHPDGSTANLLQELKGADVIILISSSGQNAGAAEVIAREAYHRKIMTAGLALSDPASKKKTDKVVSILRPFATVLVVSQDEEFIPAMLTALRA
ncbi:MAG: hypothetical protein COA52_01735 [Hyphomicrobiales bacterium]|nr:hypothetical protein [Hyphomicrobiales bacterium]PCJ96438.1 MAG: hypothetical protein COA52_01735 [Hyphomicrobiales bacterium]